MILYAGSGANMERLTKIRIDRKALDAARDLSKAIWEIVDIDWAALSTALAAAGYGAPEAEPDKNPVRFIGIRKGGWKRGRGKRHEQRKIVHTP